MRIISVRSPRTPFNSGGTYNSQKATRGWRRVIGGERWPIGGGVVEPSGEPAREGGRWQDGVGEHHGLVRSCLGAPRGAELGRGRVSRGGRAGLRWGRGSDARDAASGREGRRPADSLSHPEPGRGGRPGCPRESSPRGQPLVRGSLPPPSPPAWSSQTGPGPIFSQSPASAPYPRR